jgi:hypothetical protein
LSLRDLDPVERRAEMHHREHSGVGFALANHANSISGIA